MASALPVHLRLVVTRSGKTSHWSGLVGLWVYDKVWNVSWWRRIIRENWIALYGSLKDSLECLLEVNGDALS